MVWKNPPKLIIKKTKSKPITPEQLAESGTEDGNQSALFAWAALNTEQYPQLKNLFAIPNGGNRHIVEAIKFVGTGTRSGVPDTMLAWPSKNFAGLFIELKVGKNKPSKEQNDWLKRLSDAGYMTSVQWSWEGARDLIIDYLERT